jgi:AcrR family transcriptional regulator
MPRSRTTKTSAPPGRRVRNREDKLRRIKTAARALFLLKGYDDATMREIARRADVSVGTLFNYASDKRDLLFLVFNDEQAILGSVLAKDPRSSGSFVGDLVAYFEPIYRLFATEPEFSRYVLRELTFYTTGTQAQRLLQDREVLIDGVAALVRDARRRGTIRSRETDTTIAQFLFGVFQTEIRRWLSGKNPQPAIGLKALARMMQIAADGLEVKKR